MKNSSLRLVGSAAFALLLFLSGALVGREVQADSSTYEVDRSAIPGTRLTSPWFETGGTRAKVGPLRTLEKRLQTRITELRAGDPTLMVGVFVRDLDSGGWMGVGEQLSFVPASLMKVAVLFHALDRLEQDPALLLEERVYPGPYEMPSPDNMFNRPIEERMVPGERYTFDDLLRRMVSFSDNHAKDLILAGVDPQDVERYMVSIGFPAAVESGRAITTPRSYGALFRILYNSSLYSRRWSEYALELLEGATYEGALRHGLPEGVSLASKFGMHFDQRDLESGLQLHECGVVYAGESPYTLCVMTRSSFKTFAALGEIVSEIGQVVHQSTRPMVNDLPRGLLAGRSADSSLGMAAPSGGWAVRPSGAKAQD